MPDFEPHLRLGRLVETPVAGEMVRALKRTCGPALRQHVDPNMVLHRRPS